MSDVFMAGLLLCAQEENVRFGPVSIFEGVVDVPKLLDFGLVTETTGAAPSRRYVIAS